MQSASSKITIIQDTREKIPLPIAGNVAIEHTALDIGDYSVVGAKTKFRIELKRGMDWVTCNMTMANRDRLKRQLFQLTKFQTCALVITRIPPRGEILSTIRSRRVPPGIVAIAEEARLFWSLMLPTFYCMNDYEAALIVQQLCRLVKSGRYDKLGQECLEWYAKANQAKRKGATS